MFLQNRCVALFLFGLMTTIPAGAQTAASDGEIVPMVRSLPHREAPVVDVASSRVVASVPAPSPAVAEPRTAPVRLNYNVFQSIRGEDLSRYVSGFRIRQVTDGNGTHLSLLGIGHPDCLRHLRFEIDTPTEDRSSYGLRIERADITQADGTIVRADESCTLERTRNCTRDTCSDIHDEPFATQMGVNYFEQFSLESDGQIQICGENRSLPEGHPDAYSCAAVPRINGGPLEFRSPATLAAALAAERNRERQELIVATCRDAESGNRDEIENLRQIMGPDFVASHEEFFRRLEERADENDKNALERDINAATTLAQLEELIERVEEFGRTHDRMRSAAVRLLQEGIAARAREIEPEGEGNLTPAFTVARERVAERALRAARRLDPRNAALRRAYYEQRLRRFAAGAQTGDDAFFNDSSFREMMSDMNSLGTRAMYNRDPQAYSMYRAYQDALTARPLSASIPMGDGRSYPAMFYEAPISNLYRRASLERQMREYRANSLMSPMGGSYSFGTPSMP